MLFGLTLSRDGKANFEDLIASRLKKRYQVKVNSQGFLEIVMPCEMTNKMKMKEDRILIRSKIPGYLTTKMYIVRCHRSRRPNVFWVDLNITSRNLKNSTRAGIESPLTDIELRFNGDISIDKSLRASSQKINRSSKSIAHPQFGVLESQMSEVKIGGEFAVNSGVPSNNSIYPRTEWKEYGFSLEVKVTSIDSSRVVVKYRIHLKRKSSGGVVRI